MEEMGAPDGTTFPGAKPFLQYACQKQIPEIGYFRRPIILEPLMEQLALSHPEISFKYIQNKQVKLHTSGNYNVKDVIYNVYGRDMAKALLDVSYENDFMKIEGFAGKPEVSQRQSKL